MKFFHKTSLQLKESQVTVRDETQAMHKKALKNIISSVFMSAYSKKLKNHFVGSLISLNIASISSLERSATALSTTSRVK